MRGELFRIFDAPAPAYFVLLLTGFLFATAAGTAWARRVGQDPDVIVDLGLAALLLGVVGGKLLHVIADGYFTDYVNLCVAPEKVSWHVEQSMCTEHLHGVWDGAAAVCHPATSDCFAWAKFWNPGYAYYGGFVFASLGAWWLLRHDRFPFWKAADMAGFAVPLGLGFGRMGCLLAGCCFGAPTTSGPALVFPPGSSASEAETKLGLLQSAHSWSLAVYPTQIYESGACLLIALFCLAVVHERKRYDGQVFVWFMGLYAIARFILEFFRADDRGSAAGLSTSQLIGIVLLALAVALHFVLAGYAKSAIAKRAARTQAA